MQTAEQFRHFFIRIPPFRWTTGSFDKWRGYKKCALGHLGEGQAALVPYTGLFDSENAYRFDQLCRKYLRTTATAINDGKLKRMPPMVALLFETLKHPKKRIIAACDCMIYADRLTLR